MAWQLDPSAGWEVTAASYVDDILSTQQANGSFIYKAVSYESWNFMTGMVLASLIQYHTQVNPDSRIPAAVEAAVTYLWDSEWLPASTAFRYSSGLLGGGNLGPVPDLNAYFSYPFYWVYAQTGDATWRDRGDAIMAGVVDGAWWGGPAPGSGAKQYNQQIMTVGVGLYWREQ